MMRNGRPEQLLDDFENARITADDFDHEAHIRVGFELLRKFSFLQASARMERGLRAITQRLGQPKKFNLTVTVAFLALIAERMEEAPSLSWAQFKADNPDLFEGGLLNKWYDNQRLNSDAARKSFIMPKIAT